MATTNAREEARPKEEASPDESAKQTGTRIWLYDRDGKDAPARLEDKTFPRLDDNQMLWVDADLSSAEELGDVWEELGIAEAVDALSAESDRPRFTQHNGLIGIDIFAVDDSADFKPVALHCFVGPSWVATLHVGELDLVDEFNKPFHGETSLGELDGPQFLALLLDWQLTGYFNVIDDLQSEVDQLDEDLLRRSPDQDALLRRLQEMRRQVRRLRHTLSAHRGVLGTLSQPEAELINESDAVDNYRRLAERLERALDAVDTTREMVVGSFDIFMTRTAQDTNDIMKRLTIISVLLLPATVIAGIMGMNFQVFFFEQAWVFWLVLGLMAVIASLTLYFARRQNWI